MIVRGLGLRFLGLDTTMSPALTMALRTAFETAELANGGSEFKVKGEELRVEGLGFVVWGQGWGVGRGAVFTSLGSVG